MRAWLRICAVALTLVALPTVPAGAQAWPGENWSRADPAAFGWSTEKLSEAERYAYGLKPTAVMVVQHGEVIASWGNPAARVSAASVRKSLISALYGIAVAQRQVDLTRTIGELGIDDRPPALTETEKTATVRDLLMARSGIYHAAAYEAPDMKQKRPARGSHAPGTFWYYNNWDFNALGTIYQRLTGSRVFDSFEQKIARPLGMQEFTANDGRYVFEPDSDHPAYVFSLSARDLARFGLMFLRGGAWKDRQIVPAAWVRESTAAHTSPADFGLDYGYLWWPVSERTGFGRLIRAGSYYALGYRGQVLAVIPSRDLVIVQLVDLDINPEGIRPDDTRALFEKILAAGPPPG